MIGCCWHLDSILLWNTDFIKCFVASLSCFNSLKSVLKKYFSFFSQSIFLPFWPLNSICCTQISWHRTKIQCWKINCLTEAMGKILLAVQIWNKPIVFMPDHPDCEVKAKGGHLFWCQITYECCIILGLAEHHFLHIDV